MNSFEISQKLEQLREQVDQRRQDMDEAQHQPCAWDACTLLLIADILLTSLEMRHQDPSWD